ncbi:hypothetical protein AHAS_Ahas04G0109000 [Arachis hypogaea]
MAGKVNDTINNGSAPPTFSLSGQNYHSIGSLIPSDNNRPRFAQLYIYDTENEVQNRVTAVRCENPFDIVGSIDGFVLAEEEPCLDALSVVGDADGDDYGIIHDFKDPDLAQKIGAATTLEVRATGIPYVFAPCIEGQCYESYSEDPKIVEQMTEIIPGLQGSLPVNAKKGFPYVGGK